jgi:hypothetical protein
MKIMKKKDIDKNITKEELLQLSDIQKDIDNIFNIIVEDFKELSEEQLDDLILNIEQKINNISNIILPSDLIELIKLVEPTVPTISEVPEIQINKKVNKVRFTEG